MIRSRGADTVSGPSKPTHLISCCIRVSGAYDSYAPYTRGVKCKPLSNMEFPLRVEKKDLSHKGRSSGSFFDGLRLVTSIPLQGND